MEIKRESIISSTIRIFFKSIFLVLGLCVSLFAVSFFFSASGSRPQSKTTLEVLPDLEGKRALTSFTAPVILQIKIHGVIGECPGCGPNHVTSESIQDILLESREGLLQNDRVRGILLHFDTPGGSAIESDNIYRLLARYKELYKVPVFGYVNGLCASGGMYVAAATDRLFCGPVGIVGSIGVRSGPFFNVYDTITKWGIQSKTITEGLDKDAMNPVRPWKENEDANLKEIMASLYNTFVDVVTTARPNLDRTRLVQEYGAKVFDGVLGKQYGYVDEANVPYEGALLALMEAAKVDPGQPYQIVQLAPKHSLLEDFVSSQSPLINGRLEHRPQLSPEPSSERERMLLLL